MGHVSVSILTSLVIFFVYYLLVGNVSADTNSANDIPKTQSLQSSHATHNYKRYHRSPMNSGNLGSAARVLQLSRSKIPIELDLLLDDDEMYDKSKRYDDYGHMRFGKRAGGGEDQFDDYGHMRFGKRAGGE